MAKTINAKNRELTCPNGMPQPHYTGVPDQILDNLNAFTGPELAVLLYVARHSIGYKKQKDRISLTQMVEGIVQKDGHRVDWGTGYSRGAVSQAVKSLEKRQWLVVTRREWQSPREDRKPQRATSEYHLHLTSEGVVQETY